MNTMPTYEYKREDGTLFEFFQGMNDKPLETCPETGQKVKRMISGGGGVVYKGTGFYITDYKNGNGNGKNGSNSASEQKNEKKETTGTSSKPEE